MKFSVITSFYKQAHLIGKLKDALEQQTTRDFEWILAIDDLDSEAREYALEHADKYVEQENKGYRYGQIINKAVKVAEGEYIVWINADSYPAPDFLEKLGQYLTPERLVNGIRMNVDMQTGRIVSQDWRLSMLFYDDKIDLLEINEPNPWKYMTLNSMSMARAFFNNIGGMSSEYVGYGKEDWDLVMRAHFAGGKCVWAMTAILYTENHTPKEEVPGNTDIFLRRLAEFGTDLKTQEKIKRIMDPERARAKEQQINKRLSDLEQKTKEAME